MSLAADQVRGSPLTYVVAGHVTRDLVGSGWRLGGSAAYCALAARRMGIGARVVTGHGRDLSTGDVFDRLDSINLSLETTTTFRNLERDGIRHQTLVERGGPLSTDQIPAGWRHPDILHLAPVFREIDSDFLAWFRPRLRCATLQGWTRGVNEDRTVVFGLDPKWESIIKYIDIAVFSNHDLNNNFKIRDTLCRVIPICVETMGPEGCLVFEHGREHFVPTVPMDIRDVTGAGDVFACALFVRYFESGDPVASARFANEFAAEMLSNPGFRTDLQVEGPVDEP